MNQNIMIFFLLCLASTHAIHITLDDTNMVIIKGPIVAETTNKFIMDLKNFKNKELNVFISSPGGSVMEGRKIISYIEMLQNNDVDVNCVVDFAASMAFVITQSCTNRYSLSSGTLMQHQMSLGTDGPLENLQNYIDMIKTIDIELDMMQSSKINMDVKEFKQTVMNDWWLTANAAVNNNVVDKIVTVNCEKSLFGKKYNYKISTFFGDIEFTYSMCPLVRNHLNVKFKNDFPFEELKEYMDSFDSSQYIMNRKVIKSTY